ncbi:phosphopyruvate hydratase [Ignisphaera sp. 4213-co]|uniref:Enolase n=1 Tax=Ignisphaera cupida TaxID=3050454 RepID=A0ABD4Z5H3_9CREN|nr:phosphopyruvate hydratase [Ignisphaera sp. 4213-co]MDK6028415.1 phosphopyruvate hydratase [Ignisphaera sp. 4213-co]
MSNPYVIRFVDAIQVLDSRGDPTVEVMVETVGGGIGRAIAPAGASRGKYEALELRDGDAAKFKGRSVTKAVSNVINYIAPAIQGIDARRQREIDRIMIQVDGTANKSRLGANAILATSLAVAKAAADTAKIPLFQYLGGIDSRILPIPLLNIINGGAHAGNELAVQEFMIVPIGFETFSEAMRAAVEIYKELKSVLKNMYGASAVNVGDEGGYAPPMKYVREAISTLLKAIKNCGYDPEKQVRISLDAAASQFYDESSKTYVIDGSKLAREKLLEYWKSIAIEFNILSIEDPFNEEDFEAYAELKKELKNKTIIVGDDLTVTSVERLEIAIKHNSVSAVIVKPNQIGTLSETLDFITLAKNNNIYTIISHRSGESEDNTIAHLAVAVKGPFIKTGAPARGERTAKYNELLRIEKYLSADATYAGKLLKM